MSDACYDEQERPADRAARLRDEALRRRGTVYLAGGINGLSDADARDWRDEATELLGGNVLDPMVRDYRGKEDENVWVIVQGDKADIDQCAAVIVYAARPSWGTAMETYYAWANRKYVVVIVPDGPVSPWLRYHSDRIVETVAEACRAVGEIA